MSNLEHIDSVRVRELAAAFVDEPGRFKAKVKKVRPSREGVALLLAYERGSLQLGARLWVSSGSQPHALIELTALRFEDDGLHVVARALFSTNTENTWASTPKLKGMPVFGLTLGEQQAVAAELTQWQQRQAHETLRLTDEAAQARVQRLAQVRAKWLDVEQRARIGLGAAFGEHFEYLLDTPSQRLLLERVAQHVTGVRVTEDRLVFDFGPGAALSAEAPEQPTPGWPASFQRLEAVHRLVHFPTEGWSLRTVCDVLTDYSDWWVVGTRGRLTLLSHEAGLTKRTTDLGAGALFLNRVLEVIEAS